MAKLLLHEPMLALHQARGVAGRSGRMSRLLMGLLMTAIGAALGGCGSGLERPSDVLGIDTAPDTAETVNDTTTDKDGDEVAPEVFDDVEPEVSPDTEPDAVDTDTVGDTDTEDDTEEDGGPDTESDTGPEDPCVGFADDTTCDDHNACTTGERCREGRCLAVAALDCDDGNPCTDNTCRPEVGCVVLANLALCEDGDPCTSRDRCAAGLCRPGVFACDDGNACTRDTCRPDGTCIHTADDTLLCEDGSACTAGDFCRAGVCVAGSEQGCTSESECTTARCGEDGRTCVFTNLDGQLCDDGDACTAGDQCQGGVCRAGPAVRCGWDSECALFRCDRREGCLLEAPLQAGRSCSDDDRCTTGDTCDGAGFCVAESPAACDDDNPCTEDSCDASWGCEHTPIGGPCNDESLCTTQDACQFGQCRGLALTCNDQNACTTDSCDPLLGCQFLAVRCDDLNPCTTDTCDPALGCVHTPRMGSCDDGLACTVGDACDAGRCVGLLSCDDGEACTIDVCDAAEGCVSVARDQCPVDLVEVTAVGVGGAGMTPGFGQWLALRNEAAFPVVLDGWLVLGEACDCEATLSDYTLPPQTTVYGLRRSDPLPGLADLAPGGPATLADFVFQFGELGDDTFFVEGDVLELIDETGALVSTFVVPGP